MIELMPELWNDENLINALSDDIEEDIGEDSSDDIRKNCLSCRLKKYCIKDVKKYQKQCKNIQWLYIMYSF